MPHCQLCFYRAQGTSPTATLAHVQGSRHFSASHVSTQLHPHCTAGYLLVSIKGDVQGLPKAGTRTYRRVNRRRHRHRGTGRAKRGRQSRRNAEEANSDSSPQGQTLSLSLSRSRSLATLVTPTTSTPVQDNIKPHFASCVPSCINPSGQRHAATNSLVG
jgi:hypothetical protein